MDIGKLKDGQEDICISSDDHETFSTVLDVLLGKILRLRMKIDVIRDEPGLSTLSPD